jgi:hypothetical protein
VVVEEEPAGGPGLGLEVATSGFASGNLQNGLILGMHFPSGTLFGVRIDYADTTTTLGRESQSTTTFAVGLAGRFAVAGSKKGFDLAIGLDAAFVKATVAMAGSMTEAKGSGSGFRVGVGPHLRYWIHPNVALGYIVQGFISKVSSDNEVEDKLERSDSGFDGAFTVTAGF